MEKVFTNSFGEHVMEVLENWLITQFPGILILIVGVFLAFLLVSLAMKRLRKILIARAQKNKNAQPEEARKRIQTLISILHGTIKVILWAIFILVLLKKLGVDIGPMLASAGIIGLAVGFGAQELVRDFIAGFFILLENQIRNGDVAIINGTAGFVERIELRTITLRDLSGVVHIFQNGKINSMSNMTKEWSAVVLDIGVAYKEDVDTVMQLMRQVGEELKIDEAYKDQILEPIEIFGLDQFADSAIVIKARIKTQPIQQWAIGREYRKRLKAAFDERGIEIPFPHTTVYWGENSQPFQLDLKQQNE